METTRVKLMNSAAGSSLQAYTRALIGLRRRRPDLLAQPDYYTTEVQQSQQRMKRACLLPERGQ
eukprot:6810462-Pyramimonas_sp.AAC.1